MEGTTQFTIGVDAWCTDGLCGEVKRVVVDPVQNSVTHLVVEPRHREGLGRLVPLDLIDATANKVSLRCTLAEFDGLEFAEETLFAPEMGEYEGYGSGQVVAWPYFGGNTTVPVIEETLPVGEVAVRRGQQVHATDGFIGEVQGLVVNRETYRVTHVLLQEGHLWGRKEVALPISSVVSVRDGIRLNISKQVVQDLPPVEVNRR